MVDRLLFEEPVLPFKGYGNGNLYRRNPEKRLISRPREYGKIVYVFKSGIILAEVTEMDTFELIQKYLSKIVRDPSTITPDATLRTLGVDSLDMVDMMVEIEEELGIRFKDEELVTMKTIGDAVSLINSKTGKESEGK